MCFAGREGVVERFREVLTRIFAGMTAGNHLCVQRATIRETFVDVKKCSVVVKADYYLHVEGEIGEIGFEGGGLTSGETHLNEGVYFLQLTEKGDRVVDVVQ